MTLTTLIVIQHKTTTICRKKYFEFSTFLKFFIENPLATTLKVITQNKTTTICRKKNILKFQLFRNFFSKIHWPQDIDISNYKSQNTLKSNNNMQQTYFQLRNFPKILLSKVKCPSFLSSINFQQHLALSQANKIIHNISYKLNIFEKCYKMCVCTHVHIHTYMYICA